MLAIRAYLLVDYRVNAEATPDSNPPAHGRDPKRLQFLDQRNDFERIELIRILASDGIRSGAPS
jgi:hypothetical protein